MCFNTTFNNKKMIEHDDECNHSVTLPKNRTNGKRLFILNFWNMEDN